MSGDSGGQSTLPHEHLFNDLSSVVDAPCYPFSQRLVDKKVTA
ncbi:phosphotriesterase-related protein, partial [Escherichia coli]